MIPDPAQGTSTRGNGPFSRPVAALALIYLLATALPASILGLNRTVPGASSGAAVLPTTVLFIVLAAMGTAFFLVRVDPFLHRRPVVRIQLLFFTLAFSAGLFVLSGWPGISSGTAMLLNSANLFVLALLLGSWMVVPLKRAAELVPVCAVMTAADLFSVFGGPSRGMAKDIAAYYEGGRVGPVPAADFLLLKVAVPGMPALVPVFGVADWIMVVFLAATAARFGLDDNLAGRGLDSMVAGGRTRPYLGVSVVGLCLAVLLARSSGVFLPALPVVAAVFLGYVLVRYPGVRRLRTSDWALVLLTVAVMAGLTVYHSASL